MRLQLLSDLHLETEDFDPEPAAAAELLVLAGDIDSTWAALERFRGWPVAVLYVAGNHEFDGRELSIAWRELRLRCDAIGIVLLERQSLTLADARGRRIRFVATTRWSDFDLFGDAQRSEVMRAASYFVRIMRATKEGRPLGVDALREEALACRAWLAAELRRPGDGCDATVALTHYGPSLRSADPRYGHLPSTASFCNADDDLLPLVELWIHGHLHWRHDYQVAHASGRTRVVCNARGHSSKGETAGYDGQRVYEV